MKKVLFFALVLISFSSTAQQPGCKDVITENGPRKIYPTAHFSSTMQTSFDMQFGLMYKLPEVLYFDYAGVTVGWKGLREKTAKKLGVDPEEAVFVGTLHTIFLFEESKFFTVPYVTIGKSYWEVGSKLGYRLEGGHISITITTSLANRKPELGAGIMIVL